MADILICDKNENANEDDQEEPTTHDNVNKITFAPSEDSDHPGHLPSQPKGFFMRTAKTLVRLGGCPG